MYPAVRSYSGGTTPAKGVECRLGNNGFAVDDDGYFIAFKTTYLTGEFGERSFEFVGTYAQ